MRLYRTKKEGWIGTLFPLLAVAIPPPPPSFGFVLGGFRGGGTWAHLVSGSFSVYSVAARAPPRSDNVKCDAKCVPAGPQNSYPVSDANCGGLTPGANAHC